ncbi:MULTISPECIES: hypothetical protein [unclassified Mesorhizobium]
MFTTARLDQYFGAGKEDPVGARAIVNGTDKSKTIFEWHTFAASIYGICRIPSPMQIRHFRMEIAYHSRSNSK